MAINAPAEPTAGTDTIEMLTVDRNTGASTLADNSDRPLTFQELMAGGTAVTEHARARGEALRAVFGPKH